MRTPHGSRLAAIPQHSKKVCSRLRLLLESYLTPPAKPPPEAQ